MTKKTLHAMLIGAGLVAAHFTAIASTVSASPSPSSRRRLDPPNEAWSLHRVIGTGGWAEQIAQETTAVDVVAPDLTLEGLRILYDLNTEGRE